MTGMAMVGLLTLAACARTASPGGPAPEPDPRRDAALVAADYAGRFRTVATVLESVEHGPQLCNAVMDSYPPQCGGPDVAGWDWSTVTAESANGTTWGTYLLVGTFDGTRFTLTEPAAVDDGTFAAGQPEMDFAAPCAEPPGGWQPVDAARAGDSHLQEAMALAQAHDGYAGLWVDQRGGSSNDPRRLVLVIRTTGDTRPLEDAVREVWGGALCVAAAAFTEAELLAAQGELSGEPGVMGSSPDVVANRLELSVFVATEERQRDLDARFGTGMVTQTGMLQPLD